MSEQKAGWLEWMDELKINEWVSRWMDEYTEDK